MPSSRFRRTSTSIKPHLLNGGGMAAEIRNLREDVQLETSGSLWGLQTAWSIDPAAGSDTNLGIPSQPLKTVEELSNRLSNTIVKVPATVQYVGNVIDSPLLLRGTHFALGASLTVSGTRTVLASSTVTTVTQLGNLGVGFPFQFDTSGIDWTTFPIGSQVRLTATGAVGMLMSVTNANQAIIGPMLTAAQGNTIPANGNAFTVESLSRAHPPIINATAQSIGSGAAGSALIIKDQTFDGNLSHSYAGGLNVQVIGCEINGGSAAREFVTNVSVRWQSCRFSMSASSLRIRAGAGIQDFNGCVVAGNTFVITGGHHSLFRVGLNTARVSLFGGATVNIFATNHRNTNGPFTIDDGSRIYAADIAAGSTGNTGIGIDCQRGSYAWQGGSAKPTVTGSTPDTNDVRIGGTTMGYTALGTGFYAFFNNANPNSILNLVGPGGGCWMAQS